MTDKTNANVYEEARQKRLEDNKKRFRDLGILKISENLLELTNPVKPHKTHSRSKPRRYDAVEPRRSTRERNPIVAYVDELDIGETGHIRKRSKLNSSWTRYLQRPLDETRFASYKERVQAIKRAEDLQKNLQSGTPSFVKSMVRSHVYSCFWLGLPSRFCDDHLPKTVLNMILEDENGAEYEAIYIGTRTGLSGGWKAFALDHKLDDGDALLFNLIEPDRFKVYIVKASQVAKGDDENKVEDSNKKTSKRGRKKLNDDKCPIKSIDKEHSPTERETIDGSNKLKDTDETESNPRRRSKRLR